MYDFSGALKLIKIILFLFCEYFYRHYFGNGDILQDVGIGHVKKPKASKRLPIPVTRALQHLGQGLSEARRRRRIPTALLAQRASINRMTLHKIERGEPGVAMGSYATVMFVLGLLEGLPNLSDAKNDPVGLALEAESLPKRIHLTRKPKPTPPPGKSGS